MAHPLDDFERLNFLDPQGMLKTLERFPADCLTALKNAERIDLSDFREPNTIVISGMGGSAIGGLILQDWLNQDLKVPIIVSRGYRLPGFVNSRTILIGISYSGNTEETLNSLIQGREKKAQIIAVTSGGKLLQTSKEEAYPHIKLPGGFQPRAALPFQFFSLVKIMEKIELLGNKHEEIGETIETLEMLAKKCQISEGIEKNPAKKIADKLKGYIPFIITPGFMKSISYRMSTQFNENSKIPAFSSFIPEALHNRVMAVEASSEMLEKIYPIIIKDPHEKIMEKKISTFNNLLKSSFGKTLEIETLGQGNLTKMFSTILLGDFTSTYLGLLYGKNPTPLKSIQYIKEV